MSSCPSTACHCGNPCLDVLPRMCQTRPRASVIILLPSVPISQQSPVAIDFETGNCDLQVLVLTCPSLLLCGCRDPVPRPCDPRAPGWESHKLGRSQLPPALWRWLRAGVSQGHGSHLDMLVTLPDPPECPGTALLWAGDHCHRPQKPIQSQGSRQQTAAIFIPVQIITKHGHPTAFPSTEPPKTPATARGKQRNGFLPRLRTQTCHI